MMSAKARAALLGAEQLELGIELPRRRSGWGGVRAGAGRKKSRRRSDPPHRVRPQHRRWEPVHVVLRTREGVPRLRRRKVFEAVRRAFRVIAARAAFRIVHLSLQHNHLHLIVESDDRESLSRGMQSFEISLARRINRACGRRGKLFAHRYHATAIRSPRQARNALAYVLNNWRHHREDRGSGAALDRFSSAVAFDGWVEGTRFAIPAGYTPLPVAAAETWLLTTGWRRHPPIDWREVPAER
jgi:REP element-mobilizing transposase RayT